MLKPIAVYVHKESGKEYNVLCWKAKDKSDVRYGIDGVVYERKGEFFFRERFEFLKKFEPKRK